MLITRNEANAMCVFWAELAQERFVEGEGARCLSDDSFASFFLYF